MPAAGRGLRFGTSAYPKELFPLLLSPSVDGKLAPRPICELALQAMQQAGALRCAVVISPEKADMIRVLGARGGVALDLAYVVQPEPLGLPHAVRCARPWLEGAGVVMALPDTIIFPSDALAEVHRRRSEAGADLALGVFPVDEPERLGPIDIDASGNVSHIYDKPGHRAIMNSWGVVSWSARFTDFLCDWERAHEGGASERAIGHAFEAARVAGMPVVAVKFSEGLMLDIGTPHGLRAALRALAERGILEATQLLR